MGISESKEAELDPEPPMVALITCLVTPFSFSEPLRPRVSFLSILPCQGLKSPWFFLEETSLLGNWIFGGGPCGGAWEE